MRPLRSFLLLLIFIASFVGLFYIFPGSHLFPALDEFIPSALLRYRNSPEGELPQKSNIIQPDTLTSPISRDSLLITQTLQGDSVVAAEQADTVQAEKSDPLKDFTDSIGLTDRQVRIMYYGDSQLEGDRITSYLRQVLREKAGGTGPGLIMPVMPVMYTKTVWIKSSPNWERYNYLSYRDSLISHKRFGPFMAICRYLPEGKRTVEAVKATMRIRPSAMADSAAAKYDLVRIFYRNAEGRVVATVKAGDRVIFDDTLRKDDNLNELTCDAGGSDDIQIGFTGNVSPDIYGVSIESRKGVVVDNIPQRGSAGLEFTMVSRNNLEESYRLLSPDLIILHYGLNIVRNVRDDYSYYGRGLSRQLDLLKEIVPGTPVLIAGLTDMALKQGDSIRSYRNIPAIIEAQKYAASSNGASFWNAYEQMGGSGSIVRWAEKMPPLAQKDYVHLTYEGADTLAAMLAASLFAEREIKDTVTAAALMPVTRQDTVSVQVYSSRKGFGDLLLKSLISYDPERPMIFSTAAFWLFLLFVLLGYTLVFRSLFLRNFYLFLVSLFFYYKSGGLFLLLLLLVIVMDFTCGVLIGRSGTKAGKRLFITISVLSNLGLLAYFKYTGFIIESINDLLGTEFVVKDFLAGFSNLHLGTHFAVTDIILPVGISFFTFQSLSYTIDVYRGKMKPVTNILDFGFYVSFFPQLVAGPIVRASEFIPQLYTRYHLDKREFSHALFLISKGLIKKIIISDFISVNFIDRVFDAPSIYSGFENLMAIYGYGLQIYCDFSGYTDIAIGIGLLFGFRLPVNFNSPYKASGIADFWRRWHISLSRWLKDYLYIPLGGNRKGKIRTYINLMLTMVLGGLWHGANIRFIIWGLLHGTGLVADKLWKSVFHRREGRLGRAFTIFLTFQFVSFCWIFFRAPDLDSIRIMLSQVFRNFSPGSYLTVLPAYGSVFLLIAAGYLVHFLPENVKESYRGLFIRIPVPVQMAVIMVIAVLLYQMRATETMPFIYFRF